MTEEKKSRTEADIESLEQGIFTGEEGGTERSTPHKDFIASIVVGLIGFLAMIIAIRLSIERSSRYIGFFPLAIRDNSTFEFMLF